MKRNRKVFIDVLKRCRLGFVAVILSFCASVTVFYLYSLPIEPFVYAYLIVLFLSAILFFVKLAKEFSKAKKREQTICSIISGNAVLDADTLTEDDCNKAILTLQTELTKLQNEYETKRRDEIDYYTTWVHQIKTPISVMRMELGDGKTEKEKVLSAELFRIEQYVDMALTFIRLDCNGNDLVIKEFSLDELIRSTVRKFAPQFVLKKLSLNYNGTDKIIITDEKWFSCILEQIVSNAIKYTSSGGVSISLENDVLCVEDTGIGIAPEDVPRIFEKGFTGENGRLEKQSSGLGLYLCNRAGYLLQIPLSVESTVGQGSRFYIDLREKLK